MKNFDEWNEIKKKTESEQERLYNVREIWWCKFGLNIGTEQDGHGELFLRPIIILRAFGKKSCLIAPLTTSNKNHPFRIDVGIIDGKNAKANLSQIKTIDTKRLVEIIGKLDSETFTKIRKTVKDFL